MNVPLFPDQASTVAPHVDALFFFILAVTVFFTVLVVILVAWFAVKYRREKHPNAVQIHGNIPLEITWSAIPLAIAMVIFVWGGVLYFHLSRPPAGSMEVYAIGKQWMWKFEHPNGTREINELHVPINRDIKMIMTSQDVIHSFFVPAFRVKNDVIPGNERYSVAWFNATKAGEYHLFCAEYCGTLHSGMIGKVIAMDQADYERWQSGGGGEGSMAASGEKLFLQLGCSTCHRADSGARGPNLNGLFGSTVQLSDGRKVVADEGYVRESIQNPPAKVVAGFQPIMPSFQGQISEEGILQLVEYVKHLSGQAPGGPVNVSPGSNAVPGATNLPNQQAPYTAEPGKK
ncbi:MAG: cytochrome c oxidase subunit II [Terriglobales bacterium]|jgi:cytochrome c oxidase subunit II